MNPHQLKNQTYGEVRVAGYTTAVLPIGATEPHNFHMPYGADSFQAEHVAAEAARKANEAGGKCVCLPVLPYGYDGNMRGLPLVMSLQPTTIIRVVHDLANSLVDCGLDYLFIVNGHGGNELKTIIRELTRDVDLFISGTNWWDCVSDIKSEVCPEPGDHAHAEETAACLHVIPELVKMDLAEDGATRKPVIEEFEEGWVKFSRNWPVFAPSTGAGDPRTATAEAGRKLVETATDRIGAFLAKLSNAERAEGFPYTIDGDKK